MIQLSVLQKTDFSSLAVQSVEGEMLSLTKVTRSEMGAYLCIAANGVPPSVSKRMMVHVHCKCGIHLFDYEFMLTFVLFALQG
jgi:hypothetical protein